MRTVLILCTGNSCRSIMAEALINHHLASYGIRAFSSGVAPSGSVNPLALKALTQAGVSTEGLRSKQLGEFDGYTFDLVVTVCDHARETCPMFPGRARVLHIGFDDPSGGPYDGYVATLQRIRTELLPVIQHELT